MIILKDNFPQGNNNLTISSMFARRQNNKKYTIL